MHIHGDVQDIMVEYFSRRWRNGYSVELAINRSLVQFYSGQRCVTTLGKLFTPMCL